MTTPTTTRQQQEEDEPGSGTGLSPADLRLLWQLALRLQQSHDVARAEAVVSEMTAGSDPSPALRRAIEATLAPAIDAIRDRERLQRLAICDPLTGLYNRRFMEEELSRRMPELSRVGQPMAVAMLDLDHFRSYNEDHGHLAGDLVLRSLAVLLEGFGLEHDVPCRYGGDEFVLIMPNATATDAAARLEPLREQLSQTGIHHTGRLLKPVTASIGVAEFPRHAAGVLAMLDAADAALYRAKKAGRNRICLGGLQPQNLAPADSRATFS